MVREQRSAIVSTYSRYVKAGWPVLRDFLDPPFSTSLRVPWFDFRHLEYHHLLPRYRSCSAPKPATAMTYEQFLAEAGALPSASPSSPAAL